MATTDELEDTINRYGLTQVYPPAGGSDLDVDVVFVHGLNGHPLQTWTSEKRKVFWPAQLLPLIIEQQRARILVYGYDADVTSFTDGVSKDKIHNHAEHLVAALHANRRIRQASERPIIFIAHSLGGLIVKRALIYSSDINGYHTDHLRSIFVSTYGILFLGTPHKGSDMAEWGSRLEWICRATLPKRVFDTEPQLVHALKKNNETLQNIDRQFVQLITRFHIYYFHEGKPTDLKGTLRFIVDEESASPNIHDVERASIQQDHIHMCKFDTESSPGFDLITEGIQRYADQAPSTIALRWDAEKAAKRNKRVAELTEIFPQALPNLTEETDKSKPVPPGRIQIRRLTDDDVGLKIVYEAAPDTLDGDPAAIVDIVAIHGIGAHPDDAWCKEIDAGHPEKGCINWLKDKHMLPSVVPNARIMRYGYRSRSYGNEPINQVTSMVAQRLLTSLKRARRACADRPLIFIAHCFGGLVIFQAIIDAKLSSAKWPGIFKSAIGILFFGTPFRAGGGLTQNELIRAAQSQYEESQDQRAILESMAPSKEDLAKLMTSFFEIRQGKNSSRVVCFFEQKSSYIGAIIRGSRIEKFVVDEDSGCLEQSEWVENYPLFRDHINIIKFGKPEEEDFLTICDVIEEIAQQGLEPVKVSPRASASGKVLLKSHGKIDRAMKHQDYTVGWICALPTELAAAVAMLDERHDSLPQQPHDDINYSLGRIGNHNVVIACLPLGVSGITSAARVADQLQSTFSLIRFGLMVGIGGGAPSGRHDIRLGDVVVSKPSQMSGGVIQYDFGKMIQQGRFLRTGSLNRPPDVLLNAVATLQARHLMSEPELTMYLEEIAVKYPKMQRTYTYQGALDDLLFRAEYTHVMDAECVFGCDLQQQIPRPKRSDHTPVVHYGLIASADQLMRDGVAREALREELDVLCFEMEAAGLMDNFPCLVIRGICDYADSHKNKRWQPYAAAVAAAYAKELLSVMPASQIVSMRTTREASVRG